MNLTREIIENCHKDYLLKGKPKQSDVFIIEFESTKIVVKDYKHKKGFVKLYGKWFNWMESSNYAFLERNNILFVPKFYGKVDEYAFAMEFVDAKPIGEFENREEYEFVPELMEKYLKALHQLKFFHADLRKRGNILISDNDVFFIDFASSIWFRKYNPFYYLLRGIFSLVDNSAVLKWKAFVCPSKITGEDYKNLMHFEKIRHLWLFNKRRKAADYSRFKDRV